MDILKTEIKVGLPQPLRVLHLSDNHFAFADERDNVRKQELSAARLRAFERTEAELLEFSRAAVDYARRHCDLLLHTGDLIDFVSHKNLEAARDLLTDVDYFMAAGNHEFSQYVGEAFEDEAYKQQSLPLVQSYFRNDLRFASRLINGVNFIAVDDTYYQFRPEELEALRREAAKPHPIVLVMHNPIHTDELGHYMTVKRQRECAYLTGSPAALLATYPEDRRRQQTPDADTLAFIDYLSTLPQLKAVITGHLHFNFDSLLFGRVPQHTAVGAYLFGAREYLFT